jgi:Fe-S-cluster containining protein
MSIQEKVAEVEAVFEALDKAIEGFQSLTGLHCKLGCGHCCFKADIEATPLEFLPFALHLYQTNQIERWYANLSEAPSPICLILNPTQPGAGLCSQYKHRGLICRLFGYSARTTKYGQKELVTCQLIKTEQSENYQLANQLVSDGAAIPLMSHFYMQLRNVDPDLSTAFLPINKAIKAAIEKVLSYYAYR